jgi:hypothetical protein
MGIAKAEGTLTCVSSFSQPYLAGRFSPPWVEDPERLSPEICRNVFDSFSIAYLILLPGHVAYVWHKYNILKLLKQMV